MMKLRSATLRFTWHLSIIGCVVVCVLAQVFGRRAGFIAVQASLASGVVDVCLIPEDSFELDGPAGLLQYIQQLLERQGHVVICVAEGAGQDLLYPGGLLRAGPVYLVRVIILYSFTSTPVNRLLASTLCWTALVG